MTQEEEARRERYRYVEVDLSEDLVELAVGDISMAVLGRNTDEVDTIFMLTEIASTAELELFLAVERARLAGFSWYEIAAALGTSRQAAQKRFDRGPRY